MATKSNPKPMASITVKGPLKIIGKVSTENVKDDNKIANKIKDCSIFLTMLTSQNKKVANFANIPEIVKQKHFDQEKLCSQHCKKELSSLQTQQLKEKEVKLDSPASNTRTKRLKKLTYDCQHSEEELKSLTEHNHETLVKVGDEFESRNSLRQYLDKNAVHWHFYYTCAQSNATLIDYRCIYYKPTVSETYHKYRQSKHPIMQRKRKSKTTDCPCMIRVKCFKNTEVVRIDRVCNHHDHPVTEEVFRNLPHAKYLPPDVKEEFLDLIALGINPGLIQKYIESVTGVILNKKNIYNYLDKMRKRSEKRKFTIKKINDLKEKIQKIQELYGNYNKLRKNIQTDDRKENVPNIQNGIDINCADDSPELISPKKPRIEVIDTHTISLLTDDTTQVCPNVNLLNNELSLEHINLTYVIMNNGEQLEKTTKEHLQYDEAFVYSEESPVYEQYNINNGKEEIPAVAETVIINGEIDQVNSHVNVDGQRDATDLNKAVLDENGSRSDVSYCGEHTVPPYYLYVLKEDRFFKPGDRLWGLEDFNENLIGLKTQFMIDYTCVEHREEPSEYFRYRCTYSAPLKDTRKVKIKRTKIKNTCPSEIRLTRFSSDECEDLQLTVSYVCNHHDHPLTEKQLYQLELSKKLPTHIKDEIRDLISLNVSGIVVRKYVELETGLVMNQCLEKIICNIERNCKKTNVKPKYSTKKLRLLWGKIQHAEKMLDEDTEIPDVGDGTQSSLAVGVSIYENDTDNKSLKRGTERDESNDGHKKSRLETCLQNLASDEETLLSVKKLQESVRCETQRNPWIPEEYVPYRDIRRKLDSINPDFGQKNAKCIDICETNTSSSVVNENQLKNNDSKEVTLEVDALDYLNFENSIHKYLEIDIGEYRQDESQENDVIIETSYDDNASYMDENYFSQNAKLHETRKDKNDHKTNTLYINMENYNSSGHTAIHLSNIDDDNAQSSCKTENTAKKEETPTVYDKIRSEYSSDQKNKIDSDVVPKKDPKETIKAAKKSTPTTKDSHKPSKNKDDSNAGALINIENYNSSGHTVIHLSNIDDDNAQSSCKTENTAKKEETPTVCDKIRSEHSSNQKNKIDSDVVPNENPQETIKAVKKSTPATKDSHTPSKNKDDSNAGALVNNEIHCENSKETVENNAALLVNDDTYNEKSESKSNQSERVGDQVVKDKDVLEKMKAVEKSLSMTKDIDKNVDNNTNALVNDKMYRQNKVNNYVVETKNLQELITPEKKSLPLTMDLKENKNQGNHIVNNAVVLEKGTNCTKSESEVENCVVALVNNKIYSENPERKSNKKNIDNQVVNNKDIEVKVKSIDKFLPVTMDSNESSNQENKVKNNETVAVSENIMKSKTLSIKSTKCDINQEREDLECNIAKESLINISTNESNISDILKKNADDVKDVIDSDMDIDSSDDVVFVGYIVPGKAPKTEADKDTPTLSNGNILDRILKPNNRSNCEIEVNVQVERLEKNCQT